MDVFERQQPEIEYPCRWSYRIIGTSDEAIRAAVVEVVGDTEHALHASNESRGGKYVSLRLTLTVVDDDHRLRIYRRISRAECVKMIL